MAFSIEIARGANRQPRSRRTLNITVGWQMSEVSPTEGIRAAADDRISAHSLATQQVDYISLSVATLY